jgi:hypothetical protein
MSEDENKDGSPKKEREIELNWIEYILKQKRE